MKSWTLIPFYLWKNTYRRWLEYAVSPLSKILIPALLASLSIVVLTLFTEIERELLEQLKKNSAYTVVTNELVGGEGAPTILRRSYAEELLWVDRFGGDVIRQIRQPLVSAVWQRTQYIPVFSYASSAADFDQTDVDVDAPPTVWLLSTNPVYHDELQEVTIGGNSILAKGMKMPDWLRNGVAVENAVAIPSEMIATQLSQGFIMHTVANLSSIDEVKQFVTEVNAYYKAEGRQVKIVSALQILENLERISAIQRVVRSLIVIGCGVILALTLGSIAWLEYRQDSYLLALLRSFGAPAILLFVHMFLENLLLVMLGISIVALSWVPLYNLLGPKLQSIGLNTTTIPTIPTEDILIVMASGFIGVLFAMIPVAFGLRKPAGLILQ